MNVWMKRGLQTALFTGGLLAAGTGIASADDSTIDVTVAVTITDNALAVLGTAPDDAPAEIDLPPLDGTVGIDVGGATIAVPISIGGNSADAAGIDARQPSAAPASGGSSGSIVDADVPVTVTGNAVGILGDATAGGTAPSTQPGADDGGASLLDVDAPVLVCGNGIGVLGDAGATCTVPAGSAAGGGTPGTGTDGTEDGTADVDGSVAVCGLGIGLLGDAETTCTAPAAPTASAGRVAPMSGVPGTSAGDVVPASSRTSISGAGGGSGLTTGGTRGSDSSLAYTGSSIAPSLLVGLLAVALGLGLTVLSRRRDDALG